MIAVGEAGRGGGAAALTITITSTKASRGERAWIVVCR
jgi:hypothetical protein